MWFQVFLSNTNVWNKSIWLLTGTITTGQSGAESNGKKRGTPHSRTGASPLDAF